MLGILTKLILNTPLIKAFETDGAIIATACGYLVAIGLNLFAIRKTLHYKSNMVVRRVMLIIIVNVIMLVLVFLVKLGFGQFMTIDTKLEGLLTIIVCAGIGAVFYAFVTLRLGLAQKLFGERLTRFTKKIGF